MKPALQRSRSAISLQELLKLKGEVLRARDELLDMVETEGPLASMWAKPRRYFEAEPGTLLPFVGGDLAEPLDRLFCAVSAADGNTSPLAAEIMAYAQFFELIRREVIPQRFNS